MSLSSNRSNARLNVIATGDNKAEAFFNLCEQKNRNARLKETQDELSEVEKQLMQLEKELGLISKNESEIKNIEIEQKKLQMRKLSNRQKELHAKCKKLEEKENTDVISISHTLEDTSYTLALNHIKNVSLLRKISSDVNVVLFENTDEVTVKNLKQYLEIFACSNSPIVIINFSKNKEFVIDKKIKIRNTIVLDLLDQNEMNTILSAVVLATQKPKLSKTKSQSHIRERLGVSPEKKLVFNTTDEQKQSSGNSPKDNKKEQRARSNTNSSKNDSPSKLQFNTPIVKFAKSEKIERKKYKQDKNTEKVEDKKNEKEKLFTNSIVRK